MPNGCDVFIRCPGQPASFAHDDRQVLEMEEKNACERLQEARDIRRNAIQKSETRKTKNIILKFPAYMALSNLIYSPRAMDGKIKSIRVPYKQSVTLGSKTYINVMSRITWRLHLVEAVE